MFDLSAPIVLGLASVLAIALFLFFWRAVRDLALPYKIGARVLLSVVLILPLGLAALTWQAGNLLTRVGSAPPETERRDEAGREPAKKRAPEVASVEEAAPPVVVPPSVPTNAPAKPKPPASPAQPEGGAPGGSVSGGSADKGPGPVIDERTPADKAAEATDIVVPAGRRGERRRSLTVSDDAKPKADWTVVPVYFGTDRKQVPAEPKAGSESADAKPVPVKYSWERGRRLELGRALVTIPKAHVIPMVERPWALRIPYVGITLYEAKEDPAKHFTINELKALSREEFLEQVRAKVANAARFKDHALIFIHGYKTKFDSAVFRTAQIAYDLKFDSAPFVYSWPSGGTLQGYTYDRESAGQAEPYLREFLDLVVNETGAKKVSIIAHSMGNQLLLRVLQGLKREKPDEVIISQLILAAPDVDRHSFENIVKSIKGIAEGVTLYTAANDTALRISRQFNGGVARAGDVPSSGPIILDGVDTIDATATSMDAVGINHSGYAENNALLTDVGLLIKTGQRPPDLRVPTLERVPTNTGMYWRYPTANR